MMRLMGDWNWWLPPFLDKILPKVELEPEVGTSGAASPIP